METKQNSKGEIGEDYIDEAVKIFGYKIIKFDFWQASADRLYYKDGTSLLAQIKFKELRKAYPDTGMEKYRFKNLKDMCYETGINGIVLFTDSTGAIYGEFIKKLKEELHGGEFNKITNTEMIYFWRKDLKLLEHLL